jgi:hypothetical protein
MDRMHKYPRTRHLESSRLQQGDDDLDSVPFADLRGRFLTVEEKLDGANAGMSFDESGQLWLQSRGHYLTGGAREKQFNLFKQWAQAHSYLFSEVLQTRYVLYGEWLYAKHTVFYDQLPHYFHEFDVLDRETGEFLSTAARWRLLEGLPLVSVPVLWQGEATTLDALLSWVGPSLYKSRDWRLRLAEAARDAGLDPERVRQETDGDDLMEGLYIKVEEGDRVVDRHKWVRGSFLNSILDAGTHWLKRPIVPNRLAEGIDLFGGGT